MAVRARHRAPAGAHPGLGRVWSAVAVLLVAMGAYAVLPHPGLGDAAQGTAVPLALAPATVAVAAPPSAAVPAVLPRSEPVAVRVPALDVTSTLVPLGLQADGSMEVPPGARPVGWYDRSPTPGERGPAVLAGHVDWNGERGTFAGLATLHPGDRVEVDRADGSTAAFTVDRVARYPKGAFPSDAVYGDVPDAQLRLITCGGAFDRAARSYEDNVVVFATLAPR
ncbi:class F sortase [Modestobacter sp. NPDC049651]|uniref:class F sortase n=1 Tax=unclassified Modestobacter TaxID=2643866 RepID=UPI0033DCC513